MKTNKIKLLISLISVLLFVFSNNYAQILDTELKPTDFWGNTHLYCVNQASNFLFHNLGYNYLDILNNIEYIRIGDLDEDEFDLVWDYEGILSVGETVTHFWKADHGDNQTNDFTWWIFGYREVPNAYTKVRKFIDGDYTLKVTIGNTSHHFQYISNTPGVPGLIDYFQNGHVYCTAKNPDWTEHGWENHSQEVRKIFTYKLLGHMCHLLQDMSVPIHSHVEVHPDECFEKECGTTLTLPTYINAGGFINPFDPIFNNNPIRGLFYTANQIADLYPSNNTEDCGAYNFPFNIYGNNANPHGTNDIINAHYNSYFPNGYYQMSVWNIQKNRLVSHSISATASLLYWFAVKAGLTEKVYKPVVTGMTSNMVGDSINGYTLFKGQTGTFYPSIQGNNINYSWNCFVCNSDYAQPWPFNIANVESKYGQTNPTFNVYNANFTGESCSTDDYVPQSKYLRAQLTVTNNYGAVNWSSKFRINPATILAGGGCPYIFVLGNDTSGGKYFTENNILHRSEFSENANQSITDVYKLNTVPKIDSNKITIQIMETENDVNYFDQIKLFAVDHPAGSKIGITESNDIVMYYSEDVSSSDYATQNFSSFNIAPYIQYGQPTPKITGLSNDFVNSHYDSTSQYSKLKSYKNRSKAKGSKGSSDSLALIGEIGSDVMVPIQPNVKDWAGSISIYTNSDTYIKPFSKRVNVSDVIIPFSQTEDNVDHIDFNFNSDYAISYFSVVPVSYEGFTKTELSLLSAVHAVNGDILSSLSEIDNEFAVMDTTAIIDLKFGSINPSDPSMVRDYVFVVNGLYTSEYGYNKNQPFRLTSNNNLNLENIAYKYRLNTNYPNPFNPKTKISYSLAKSGITRLAVYDVLGRLMNVLVNEYKSSGEYTVEFNGSHLSSGVYIYRLESNDFVDTKRMLLIK